MAHQRLPDPYRDEAEVAHALLVGLAGAVDWAAVSDPAGAWIEAIRRHPAPVWSLESLLARYPLDSVEGLALMRLAEALLRTPDTESAAALIADQLGRLAHPTAAPETSHRLTRALLAAAARFSAAGLPDAAGIAPVWGRAASPAVVALSRRMVQWLGRQFVLGQDIHQALRRAQAGRRRHQGPGAQVYSFDMLGEGARTPEDAQRHFEHYSTALEALAEQPTASDQPATRDGLSIKLSALHARCESAQHGRVMDELLPRLHSLCDRAARAQLNLTLDAEESERLELSLDVLEALVLHGARHHPSWGGLGLALQAYQSRALPLVGEVIRLARQHGVRLMCRLVKGAYWDSEIKRAQELGLRGYPVFTHKHHTDLSYLACAQALLQAPDAVYPQFATHNAATLAAVQHLAARCGAPFELQRLHGMGESVYQQVLKTAPESAAVTPVAVRIYAPVGPHEDLLAYLVRRLLENGANASFVHQLADAAVPPHAMLASPLWVAEQPALPLPVALYGGSRPNSFGLDLNVQAQHAPLEQALVSTVVPAVAPVDPQALPLAVERALTAWPQWRDMPVAQRAAVLQRAADAMQAQLPQLAALLVKEAFKTWDDAIAEVREAVDFLRYYAVEAQRLMVPVLLPQATPAEQAWGVTGEHNALRWRPRGVWACISPWNFPLAIFVGQVAAAVVTGNAVLAKPAEQTPAIAQAAVRVLHQAGVPAGVLQLLVGEGNRVGAALVADARLAGVVFTGSTQVAKQIQRALAAKDGPIVPLIAETGGLNAMLVDTTALPEQVIDAVVQSAFRSAGQRCSALRLLCVHEQVADALIGRLCAAAQQLVVGDPSLRRTDVGPVIDAAAYSQLQQQLARLDAQAQARLRLPSWIEGDWHFVPPHIYELARIDHLREEVFGPVLHVVRWGSGDVVRPQDVIEAVNALGYGLTLGIQTRRDSLAQALAAQASAGNVYVNRNMVGAVVGAQPFGGQAASGTGPKAGGPHYLPRFCTEQTLTINTTAAGGNVALLSASPLTAHRAD